MSDMNTICHLPHKSCSCTSPVEDLGLKNKNGTAKYFSKDSMWEDSVAMHGRTKENQQRQ